MLTTLAQAYEMKRVHVGFLSCFLLGVAFVSGGIEPDLTDIHGECPTSPQRSGWRNCTDFKQDGLLHYCYTPTGYQGVSRIEKESSTRRSKARGYIARKYEWIFKGNEYVWNPVFPRKLYQYYKDKPRPPTRDYSIYATDPHDDEFISQLVSVFRSASEKRGFDEYETATFVMRFVRSLPYTPDDVSTPYDEYPRYPIETLVDNGGDCEDASILAAVLIDGLGYSVVLLELPDHMAVGVRCEESLGVHYKDGYGQSYCYLESTGKDWQIGQIPDKYRGTGAVLRYLTPKPIITIRWSCKSIQSSSSHVTYETNTTVKNEGSATARNLRIWTGFESTEDEEVYSQTMGKRYDLKPSEELNSIATLPVPRGAYTRLHIIVFGDNFIPEEQLSDWLRI